MLLSIFKNRHFSLILVYDLGMASFENYIDDKLRHGRGYFSRAEALSELGATPTAFGAAITRLIKKGRLANPKHGFYLILRPEDQVAGAPDPLKWIDPLMRHLGLDYRVSLLRAASFHGSSHQAAMVFQVIVPRQVRGIELGRHRLEFIYQSPSAFAEVNREGWLVPAKTDAGVARMAGIELALLDCARYFHKAAGINGVAQIVKDIGGRAAPGKLARLAVHYENSSVRRLGYLLDRFGHVRQAEVLQPFARKAKSAVALDPSIKPLLASLPALHEKDARWRLMINEAVEVDF